MKKKYLLILFVLTSIIGINKVSAIYNGGSVPGGSSLHGSCPNNTKKYCLYNNNFKNPVHETVKITLYYFNESGSRIQVGNSIYATNKISGIRNAGLSVNGIIEDKNISRKSSQLEAYLLQDVVFDKYLSYLGVSRGELTLKSEKAPNGKYGYRFIIEPAFTAYRQNVMYLVTTKEIAEYDKMNSSVSWTSLSSVMYLEYNDVGITAGNSKGTSDINAAKNINNGWGYNIVDVSGKTTTEACEWKTATSCCHEKNSLTGTALANFKTQHPACFPQETPPKPTCDFSLKTSIPNNCETSSDGYVKDTEDWSCIFMSTLASGQVDKFGDLYSIAQEYQKISSHFYKWQNNYCAVYCREWVEYHLPENNLSVLAGTHFVLGNQHISKLPTNFSLPRLKPITFVGRSECRVTREKSNKNDTSINYDKFQTDFAKADEKVKNAWDDWQIAIKKDEAIAGSTNVSSSNDCNWTCDSKDEETGSCVSGSYKNHRKNPKTVFYNDGSGNKNVTPNSYCDSSKPKYVKNHKTLYDNTVAARNAIVKQIKDCNNFVMKNEIFEPSLDFDYTEPIYGRSVQDLDYDLNINIQTDYFNSNSKVGTYRREDVNFNRFSELSENSDFVTTSNINGASSKINSWNCSNKGQTCSLTTTTYPSNSWLKQWTTKTYDYKLPSGIYQNISKPSGESYK